MTEPEIIDVRPQPGPQLMALESTADIIIYGGAAGGGKSWLLVHEPLRWVTDYPGFRGGIFRRTYPQLKGQGGIWDECQSVYRGCDAHLREGQELDATFPSGANIAFLHLQHEKTKYEYMGHQFCCEVGTLVQLADGTMKSVESLKYGDYVRTLQGWGCVMKKHAPRMAECVKASVFERDKFIGSQVHTTDHAVLTPDGWRSYDDIACELHQPSIYEPNKCCDDRRLTSSSSQKSCAHSQSYASSIDRSKLARVSISQHLDHQYQSEACAYDPQVSQDSDCEGFDDEHPDASQPDELSFRVVLAGPWRERVSPFVSQQEYEHEVSCARFASSPQDSQGSCLSGIRPNGERSHRGVKTCQSNPRQPSDVAEQTPKNSHADAQGSIQKHSRSGLQYAHPYTKEPLVACEQTLVGKCFAYPCGKRLVVDITIAKDSHYCTATGLINKNCYLGFDELTHFTETQFFYMLSRNRSTCGVKPYVIATCNPEPGWVADFLAWWIDPELGTAIPERSGVLRYFVRVGDDLCWADSKEALIEKFPEYEPDDILSVTFIEASLSDNEILQRKDPGYRAKLMALSKIERDRLLGRNWKVAEGAQIDETWIRRYTHNAADFEITFQGHLYKIPISRTRRIATIDTAGTSKEKAAVQRGSREPSWSICAVWDTLELWQTKIDGIDVRLTELLFLRHVWRQQVDWNQLRQGINGELETWNVTKAYIENAHFGQALACEVKCCSVELIGPVIEGMGDHGEDAKLERAIASGMLARFEQGKIFIPRSDEPWVQAWLKEVRGWTGKPNEVADQIDTISYASYVSRRQAMVWGGTLPHHSPNSFRSAENGQGFRQVATRSNYRS